MDEKQRNLVAIDHYNSLSKWEKTPVLASFCSGASMTPNTFLYKRKTMTFSIAECEFLIRLISAMKKLDISSMLLKESLSKLEP